VGAFRAISMRKIGGFPAGSSMQIEKTTAQRRHMKQSQQRCRILTQP